MQSRRLFKLCSLPTVAVSAVALISWLYQRGILQNNRPDPFSIPPANFIISVLASATIVMVAVALAGRLYDSRWAACMGSIVAGVVVSALVVAVDWVRTRGHGLVGHDMWFGVPDYWAMVIYRSVIVVMMFAVVVTATWGIGRRAHRQRAG